MIHNSLPVVVMRAEVTAGVLAGSKLELANLEFPIATNGSSFKHKYDTQFPTSSGCGG